MNYQDDALPVFRNNCLACHNPDKKTDGLDLSTYATMLAGNSDGPVVTPGDAENSVLYRVITHEDEPTMPPKRDKLPKADLDLIKAWIAAGALETANGKPPAVANPVNNLTLSAASSEVRLESSADARRSWRRWSRWFAPGVPARSIAWPPAHGRRSSPWAGSSR